MAQYFFNWSRASLSYQSRLSASKWYDSSKNICNSNFIAEFHVQALNRMDLGVLTLLSTVLGSPGTVFLYCFIGSLSTDQFIDFGQRSYEFDWYKLPINLQTFVQLIIADAQRPQIYNGFNIIDLNLPAFVKV